jgi:arylsulfatase A-like enzyme
MFEGPAVVIVCLLILAIVVIGSFGAGLAFHVISESFAVLLWAALRAVSLAAPPFLFLNTPALADRPNFVVVIADDMGYGDMGANTPSLNGLAQRGMRFTDFHATPYCTPTRADFQTGRYHQRMGIDGPIPARGLNRPGGMPGSEVTIAEALRPHGYNTALIGKWHLGYIGEHTPDAQGYNFFFGMKGGMADHFTHRDLSGAIDWWRNGQHLTTYEYSTTAITRETLAFLRRTAKPFFLVVAWQAVHAPIQAPNGTASYDGMMRAMDKGIGQIVAALPQNTYVFFVSDNGGVPSFGGNNGPLRGEKGQIWEGGQRVPAIAAGPGVVRGTSNATLAALDLYPTILQLAGVSKPVGVRLDGFSMVPLLNNTGSLPPRRLFWTIGNNWAVRDGQWKLGMQSGVRGFYDLSRDIGEEFNVAATHPGLVARMQEALARWRTEVRH